MPARKYIRSEQGFTLLEMGMALFIILLMAGIAMPMTSGLLAEERLRQHARELQIYARTARRLAITENRPYEIVFAEHSFLLQPYLTAEDHQAEVVSSHEISKDSSYLLERWGDQQFSKPADQAWIFQPNGICEPIRVHFQSGKGWIEFIFNPLTAGVRDEIYHFP